jgi:hypothetical protein
MEIPGRRPDMRLQGAMTCIAANYQALWDELQTESDEALWRHVRHDFVTSGQSFQLYYTDLEHREAELNEAHSHSACDKGDCSWSVRTTLTAACSERRGTTCALTRR